MAEPKKRVYPDIPFTNLQTFFVCPACNKTHSVCCRTILNGNVVRSDEEAKRELRKLANDKKKECFEKVFILFYFFIFILLKVILIIIIRIQIRKLKKKKKMKKKKKKKMMMKKK